MFGLLRDVHVWSTVGVESENLNLCMSYCTISGQCQDGILAVPFTGRVGVSGQLSDQGKGVLQADRIGKPKTSALDGTGKRETRIPVSQTHAVLNIDARHWIGCAEAPFVVHGVADFESVEQILRLSGACARNV